MVWVRGAPAFYDKFWPDGWRWSDVAPYFAKAETYDHAGRGELRGADGPTSCMSCEAAGLPRAHQLFVQASDALSRKSGDRPFTRSNPDYNDARNALGVGAAQWNIKDGVRQSTDVSYLTPEVRRRKNLTVLGRAFVTKVELEGGRAVGVRFRRGAANLNSGESERHRMTRLALCPEHSAGATAEVCLCGGAFQSPQLLMVSGVGPREELARHGIPQVVDSPGVGENLQDHLMTRLLFRIKDEKAFQEQLETLAVGVDFGWSYGRSWIQGILFTCTDDSGVPDVQFMLCYNVWGGKLAEPLAMQMHFRAIGLTDLFWQERVPAASAKSKLCMLFPCLTQPKSKGRVRLNSGSALDYPELDMNYLAEQEDVDALVRAQNLMRRIVATKPLKDVLGKEVVNQELPGWRDPASQEYNEAYARSAATTIFHPTCTCAIGTVVDKELRVEGVEGLRVCDASVMPKITPGNTNWPCIAIAEKAADLMKASPSN